MRFLTKRKDGRDAGLDSVEATSILKQWPEPALMGTLHRQRSGNLAISAPIHRQQNRHGQTGGWLHRPTESVLRPPRTVRLTRSCAKRCSSDLVPNSPTRAFSSGHPAMAMIWVLAYDSAGVYADSSQYRIFDIVSPNVYPNGYYW